MPLARADVPGGRGNTLAPADHSPPRTGGDLVEIISRPITTVIPALALATANHSVVASLRLARRLSADSQAGNS